MSVVIFKEKYLVERELLICIDELKVMKCELWRKETMLFDIVSRVLMTVVEISHFKNHLSSNKKPMTQSFQIFS